MRNLLVFCFFVVLLSCISSPAKGGPYNEGMIDNDLKFQDFSVSDDGIITGTISNTSNKVRHGIKLDMWITNISETRIFWRKSFNLGDLPPGGRYEVKESGKGDVDSSLKLDFHFRTQMEGEFRNEGRYGH